MNLERMTQLALTINYSVEMSAICSAVYSSRDAVGIVQSNKVIVFDFITIFGAENQLENNAYTIITLDFLVLSV